MATAGAVPVLIDVDTGIDDAHALLLGSPNDEDGVRYNLTFRVMQPAAN